MRPAGLVAEHESADEALDTARGLQAKGYRHLEVYGPYPVRELVELIHPRRPYAPRFALVFGLSGAGLAYLLQWWVNVVRYPLNVGGFPLHSWPAFIPITFEMGILFGSLGTFFGLFVVLGLPRLYHPIFEVEGFERASIDRFFISVEARDDKFDRERTAQELLEAGALRVEPYGRLP